MEDEMLKRTGKNLSEVSTAIRSFWNNKKLKIWMKQLLQHNFIIIRIISTSQERYLLLTNLKTTKTCVIFSTSEMIWYFTSNFIMLHNLYNIC